MAGLQDNKLTHQQELFSQEIVSGKTQRQAYYIAYPVSIKNKWKDTAVDTQASILMSNRKIIERIDELRSKIDDTMIKNSIKTREDIINKLEELIKTAEEFKNSRDANTKLPVGNYIKEVRECLKEQGKLYGYYVEKREDLTPREYKEVKIKFIDAEGKEKE